jgi:hypothetical protein
MDWNPEAFYMGNRALFDLIQEHRQLADHVAKLEAEIARDRPAALAALPATYGYADMDSFIRAVRDACQSPARVKIRRAPKASAKRTQTNEAAPVSASPAPQTETSQLLAAAPKSAEPPPLDGTSLDDPKHFGLLPDETVLDASGVDSREYQTRLSAALTFAQKVLHTSGVPAVIWREWRQFERKASEALRALNTVVRTNEP